MSIEMNVGPVADEAVRKGQKAQAKLIAKYRSQGLIVDANQVVPADELGDPAIFKDAESGRYIQHAGTSTSDYVTHVVLTEDGEHIAATYSKVDPKILDTIQNNAERRAAENRRMGAGVAAYEKAVKKLRAMPVVSFQSLTGASGRTAPSLDIVDDLIAETEATVEVVRGSVVLVSAKDPQLMYEVVAGLDVPKSVMSRLEAGVRRYEGKVKSLQRCLHDLGSLAVAYVETGQRPPVDVGKGKANRITPTGLWVQ